MGKPGRKPQAQVEALRGQITSLLLNGVPTAKIAESVNLSVHTPGARQVYPQGLGRGSTGNPDDSCGTY